MPIFEYHCKKCGNKFEEIVFGDETPKCPKCGSEETEKLLSRCCCRMNGSASSDSFDMPEAPAGGGCSGCSGGSCASCGGCH